MVASAWRRDSIDGLVDGALGLEGADVEAAAASMIDAIGEVRRTDALVLLVGLAAVAPAPFSGHAREVATALEVGGVRAPAWLADVGGAEVTGTWRISHVLGDGDDIVLAGRHRDGSEHSIVVYVDHNLGGIAKDAFLAGPADELLATYEQVAGDDPDLTIEPMALADAAAWIRGALAETDRTFPPVVTEDYPAIRPLLDARLAALPAGGQGPQVVESSQADRQALIERFSDSPHGQLWRDDEDATFVVEQLVRFRCDHGDHRPLRWSPVLVETFLLDWWPRKVVADAAVHEVVPDVLTDWVRFATAATGLRQRHVDDILDAIETRAGADPAARGIDLGALLDDGAFDGDVVFDLDESDAVIDGPGHGLVAIGDEPLEPFDWTGIPNALRDRVAGIVDVCDRACEAVLDTEYQGLARRLVALLARKRPSPLQRGRPEIWAGGVLWALGQVNWLFARNATVHVTGDQLAEAVGAKPKSIAAKATVVSDAADIAEFDPRFTRRELQEMGLFRARLMYRY